MTTPWSREREAIIEVHQTSISLADVSAAYLRPQLSPTAPASEQEVAETLLAWADTTQTARVINRPACMAPNTSKPLQARLILQFGLAIPETLVTTDPTLVRGFLERHEQIVYKSVSGIRSIVRRLTPERLEALDSVVTCPTQFQRYIPGRDLRVHVIGDEVHALTIQCDCDDYRYASRVGARVTAAEFALDVSLAERLRSLAKSMGLLFAGIDLRETPGGEVYCLEVNPSPGFTFYEDLVGINLSGPLASVLTN